MGADSTFPHLLLAHAAARPHAPALREKQLGIWQTLSWAELRDLVGALALGLEAAGLRPGQHLLVLGENRPRLYAAMLAAQVLGAVPVPLYQDAVAAEYRFPVELAEVRHAVVEDQEQLDKLLELRSELGNGLLAQIWVDDPRGLRHYRDEGFELLDALLARGQALFQANPLCLSGRVNERRPEETAALFFTSGTTGVPKGVVHTHASLLDRARAGQAFDRLTEREEVLAYLPPAWIGQNIFSFAQWLQCGYVVNCPESPATVAIDLKEIGPSYYFAPPRVFEALLTSVSIRMEDASAPKRWLYARCMDWARAIGPRRMAGERLGLGERLRYGLGELLVYGPLRNALGLSRVRVAYTAGEAIGPDLFSFFRAIGVNLKQLYGSTETAVFVCLQPDHEVQPDTVGVPIEGVEIQVAEGGEVWVRSRGLLQGYYRNPEATAEVLTAEGWYRTGDAGFIGADGHLKIIDRAKDVGRLASGAMFAPKYIENKLKFFPQIKEAVAFGDAREQVCVLLNIDFEAVGNWAERRGLAYAGYVDLAGKPEVLELMRGCVEQVNADLARDERLAGCQVARFLVLHKELDADDGELTRTRKVRRGFIGEKYAVLVDALYGGLNEQFIRTQVRFEDGREGEVSATLKIVDAKRFPVLGAAA
ncbi:AMP-dependent synthetase/ligase [Inhella proteolytica]|uniref:AMP-binding protein n=1 Tax=Inhella proteolytica TaxID=2795029 RepID=A0A931NEB4_9BURK|nr:AMP-binding protein [Inhella proteolytica]MBH9577517.1 AMP-binding protein [Inhella proteolytica]